MSTATVRESEIRKPNDGPLFIVSWWPPDKQIPLTKIYRTAKGAAERVAELRAEGTEPRVWRSFCTWREVEL